MIKKNVFALLILLTFTKTCFAGADIFISCKDIKDIKIVQILREPPFVDSKVKQYIYSVDFSLRAESGKRFLAIKESAKPDRINVNGTIYDIVRASLHTGSGIVSSDFTEGSILSDKNISIAKGSKKAAFETADNVCSKIKPKTLFIYDILDALGVDMKHGIECSGKLVPYKEYDRRLHRCAQRLAKGRSCDDLKMNCKPSRITKDYQIRIAP